MREKKGEGKEEIMVIEMVERGEERYENSLMLHISSLKGHSVEKISILCNPIKGEEGKPERWPLLRVSD